MRRDTNPDNFEARIEEYDQGNPLLSPWTGKPLMTGERVPGYGAPAAAAPQAAPQAAPAAKPKIGEGTIIYSTDGSGKRQIFKDGRWQPL
jgi:hypothetical protein